MSLSEQQKTRIAEVVIFLVLLSLLPIMMSWGCCFW